jgi:two-component system, cell cycle sensor histidine kinase and response regulator CckA
MILRPIKVLLVEADAGLSGLLTEQLHAAASPDLCIDVLVLPTLGQTLKHLSKNQRVDFLLLDLFLPDSQGMETLLRVRARTPLPSIVVLAETGQEATALEAMQKGAQDYLLRGEGDARMLRRLLRYACERRRSLDELRERREFSRLISQNVTDLIMVLDKEGRRLYHSPSYKGVLGDLEFVKGSTAFLEIHPEDRERVNQVFRQTLATGLGQRIEYRFLLKDGTVRFIESQQNVIRDRWGKPWKMVVVSRDITERKQAEQALRESEQRYKHLLGSTTDYIFTVKVQNGRSVATTHGPGCEALTGYTQEDFAKSPHLWLGMVPAEDRPAVLAQVSRLMQGELPPPIEHRLIRKDGQLCWIRNTSVPRKDEQGLLVAYDGLISDITERKLAEERLKRAYAELAKNDEALRKTLEDLNVSHEALKTTQLQLIQAEKFESIGTLAAGVAHEVKNPLQTILMGLAYLNSNLPPNDENFRTVAADMRDAVKRADTIVRELLTLSAATHIHMQDVDFNAVVERSLFLVNYQINAARIHARKDLAPALPPVRMDRTRIEQVFLNLFLNAIQAMPQGGTLTVRTRTEQWIESQPRNDRTPSQIRGGDTVVVAEVQDTGVGIPEPNLRKVFDPFFTTKPVGSGTGLGLSVAKQIVDLHGGIIDIRNAAEGGVRVTLVLKAQETTTT